MKIENETFKIFYSEAEHIVFFEGSIRLWDPSEYQKIKQFLLDILELEGEKLCIDFTGLEFLNSSGISMMCKFIFDVKKMNNRTVRFVGRHDILWQKKSLGNLQKLWNKVELEFV